MSTSANQNAAYFPRLEEILSSSSTKLSPSLLTHISSTLKTLARSGTNGDADRTSLLLKLCGFEYRDLPSQEELEKLKVVRTAAREEELRVRELLAGLGSGGLDEVKVQDLVGENEYWARAGIGLDAEDALLLQAAMEKIARDHNHVRRVRFFGIVHSCGKDYFVIEGNSLKNYHEKLPEEYEPRGQGVNFQLGYTMIKMDCQLIHLLGQQQQ